MDDHFIVEGSRVEAIAGRLVVTPPANEPHGEMHLDLGYVIRAHLAPGYKGAIDMLTRTGHDSDFAPDASVYPAERDPVTGGRKLEELAFEVSDSQPVSAVSEKARELVRRGVRRVFCIVVGQRRVLEWSPPTDAWSPTRLDAVIDDRCFVRPLPIAALLDAASADDAVIAALRARNHPALEALREQGRQEGREEGREALVEALMSLFAARGLRASVDEDARIRAERSYATLSRWMVAAASASSVRDALGR